HRPEGQEADPAAPRPRRLHLPGVQPAAHAERAGEHHAAHGHRRPQARQGVAGPGGGDRRARGAAPAPADAAVRRTAAARRRGAGAGGPAGDHLRCRADREPRLPGGRGGPRLPAPLGGRAGPDHRDGHPRPGRRLLRGPRAVSRGRPHRRRDAPADRRAGPGPHEGLRRPGAHVMTVLKTSMRNFFAHKGRMALSAVAVLLSVAFVCGTLVFTDTMSTTFDKLFAATSADVTVSSRTASDTGETTSRNGKPPVIPASVLDEVRKADGVRVAEGTVFATSVTVVAADLDDLSPTSGGPTIVGSWNSNDARTMEITSGKAPKGPDQIMVDSDTADKHGLELGDEIGVMSAVGTHRAKISGITDFTVTNPGAAIFFLDTKTAQQALVGKGGVYTNVQITAADGVTHEQ